MLGIEKYEAAARGLGAEHARNAASWVVDGNTSQEHIRRVLAMLEDGDPAAYDYLPQEPNLSGEWAGSPTPDSLCDEIGMPINPIEPGDVDRVCDAYEAGVSETFAAECERILRAQLS